MCQLFAHQPQRDYESQTRSLRIDGHSTSIRLEMAFWDTLEEIASKQDMKMIKDVIKKLDVVLAQVLIEAIIMEVSLDDTRNVGVSYLQTKPSQPGNYFSGIGAINNGPFLNKNNFATSGTNGVGSLPGGFSYAAAFGQDFQATLTAIATDSAKYINHRRSLRRCKFS